jgi:hypothetical protein
MARDGGGGGTRCVSVIDGEQKLKDFFLVEGFTQGFLTFLDSRHFFLSGQMDGNSEEILL